MQPVQTRIWDGQQMHYLAGLPVPNEPYLNVWLEEALAMVNQVPSANEDEYKTAYSWRLMRTVGQPDRQGELLYECDLVEWNGRIFEIGWSEKRCGYALFQPFGRSQAPAFSLSAQHARQLRLVGNRYQHPDLLQQRHYSQAA